MRRYKNQRVHQKSASTHAIFCGSILAHINLSVMEGTESQPSEDNLSQREIENMQDILH